MSDPLAILGLKPGDLLVAAACLHRYREPHMVALAQRLATANSIGTEQATSTLGSDAAPRIEGEPQ